MSGRHLLAITLILLSTSVSAQITLDSSDFNLTLLHEIYGVDSQRLSRPLFGSSVVWDYSGLQTKDLDTVKYQAANDTIFKDAFRYKERFLGIDTFLAKTFIYEIKDTSSFREIGARVNNSFFDLFQLTGNQGDSIYITEQSINLNGEVLNFPVSYLKNWSTDYRFSINFLITVASIAHNKVPYELVTNTTDVSLVRGTGQLKIPDGQGGTKISNAVLVQRTTTYHDSLYQNGIAAPPIILAAMGIRQNQRRTEITYSFYSKGNTHPDLFMIADTSTGLIRHTHFYLDATSNLERLSKPKLLEAYPIPSSSIVNLDFSKLERIEHIEVVDVNGREVLRERVNGQTHQVDLSGLATGQYWILARDKNAVLGYRSCSKI